MRYCLLPLQSQLFSFDKCYSMRLLRPINAVSEPFVILTAFYFLTSLGHFAHNAQFICEYPNLPAWLTPWKVMAVWVAITLVGVVGFSLMALRWVVCGLLLVAAYAALGFDGLGHYAVAPMAFHTLGANVTILSEVVAAALLLTWTLFAAYRDLSRRLFVCKRSLT